MYFDSMKNYDISDFLTMENYVQLLLKKMNVVKVAFLF